MKYPHERHASAEISRLVLQRMAAHAAAFTPPNFAVWYEYLSGVNPELTRALDKLLETHPKLDDAQIEKLYNDYVSECGGRIHLVLREGLQRLLAEINRITQEAEAETETYGNRLETYQIRLQGDLSADELSHLVQGLTEDTRRMHASVQHLSTDLKSSHAEIEHLRREVEIMKSVAMNDALTGVLNRRGFEEGVEEHFAAPVPPLHKGYCLLMLDVDHFKKINDGYGHLFGDKVLTAIAATLKSKVQGQDLVGRLGGEEFAILLMNTNLDGAFVVAEHIRKAVEQGKIRRLDINQEIGGITLSIGVTARKGQEDLYDLLARADKALYRAKEQGRNRIEILA